MKVTLGRRRKEIRQIRQALSLAMIYTEPHMRDISRSDGMLAAASVLLSNLRAEIQAEREAQAQALASFIHHRHFGEGAEATAAELKNRSPYAEASLKDRCSYDGTCTVHPNDPSHGYAEAKPGMRFTRR